MSRLNNPLRLWRLIVVALLLVALLGPWLYDRVNVPAEYPCSAPYIRLEGDFCGEPHSGIWIVMSFVGGFGRAITGVFTGEVALAEIGRSLPISLLPLLLLLPVFSTLLLILRGDGGLLRVANVIIWSLATAFSWLMFLTLSPSGVPPLQFWGLWLYVGTITIGLVVEVVVLLGKRKH